MRWLVLAMVCGACGRLGFDPVTRTGDAAVDGTPDGDGAGSDAPAGATKYYLISGNGAAPAELLEVDLVTGQLVLVGNIPPSFGTMIGLAYWDANTLYASGTTFVKITLSPFTVAAETGPVSDFSALERVGNMLVGISQTTSRITSFTPGSGIAGISVTALTPAVSGGDITQTSDGTWYWYTNTTKQLYTIDLAAATAVPIGSPNPGAPFMTGLVHDDADNLFVVGATLFPIDKVTSLIGTSIDVCLACPTSHPLTSGDTTRSP
ncbi:MAG: hypothetical protein IPQ07_26660 [Myxococcales bacterium]|nr:hypothetical protein [Myxococcales bacterium]